MSESAITPIPTRRPAVYMAVEVNGSSEVIGADVESHIYASISLETFALSVTGRMMLPTYRDEK